MKKYYTKQRTMGLILVLLSVITTLLTGGDPTVALLLSPAGLYLICTKEKIIYDDVENNEEES